MGELVDPDLLLATAPQELARAQEFARSQARGDAATKARQQGLRGSLEARQDLKARWDPLVKDSPQTPPPNVYAGDGPPSDSMPLSVGAWYYDATNDQLYHRSST